MTNLVLLYIVKLARTECSFLTIITAYIEHRTYSSIVFRETKQKYEIKDMSKNILNSMTRL